MGYNQLVKMAENSLTLGALDHASRRITLHPVWRSPWARNPARISTCVYRVGVIYRGTRCSLDRFRLRTTHAVANSFTLGASGGAWCTGFEFVGCVRGCNFGEHHGIRHARGSHLDGPREVPCDPRAALVNSRRCLVCSVAHLVHSNRTAHAEPLKRRTLWPPSYRRPGGRER